MGRINQTSSSSTIKTPQGAELVGGNIRRFRAEFAAQNVVDPTNWDISAGPGMTLATQQGQGNLNVTMGTTANSVTSITRKEIFTAPFRVTASMQLSAKIVNSEVYLEVVACDPVTGVLDETRVAAWKFAGSDNLTATNATYQVQNGGTVRVIAANVSVPSYIGTVTTAPATAFEIEHLVDDMWFHARSTDNAGASRTSYQRNTTVPDPNRTYRIRLRFVNGATAPASSVIAYVGHVVGDSHTDTPVEIVGSRGSTNAAQALPVSVSNSVNLAAGGQTNPQFIVAEVAPVTVANLGAGATYTQPTIDGGTTTQTHATRARVVVSHLAGVIHGTLVLEESADNTTFRRTFQSPIPSDGLYHSFDVSIHHRYYRWLFVNGATAQTAFWLSYITVHGEGASTEQDRALSFPLTPAAGTAIAASGSFLAPALDLLNNHNWTLARLYCVPDQVTAASGIAIQQSMDGTTWFTAGAVTGAAGIPVIIEQQIVMRYVRAIVANSTTASTATRAVLALVTT